METDLKDSLVRKCGIVKDFAKWSGRGHVGVDGYVAPFDETWFHSGRPIRSPLVGESVDVLMYEDGAVISLRAREDEHDEG